MNTNYYREFTKEEYREECAKLNKKINKLKAENKQLEEKNENLTNQILERNEQDD